MGRPVSILDYLAVQFFAPPGEKVPPDDDLHVTSLVLDGHEDGPIWTARVLLGHRPASDRDPCVLTVPLDIPSREQRKRCLGVWVVKDAALRHLHPSAATYLSAPANSTSHLQLASRCLATR